MFPPSHDFEWTPTTREQHILGRHPHVSIEDEVFVETVGGSLTVKVENNTEDGEGIFSEPVDEPLQSLADAEIAYARIGPLILLRMLPYKETVQRYLVFNTRTREVRRLDGIGQACQRLPEDQGIIFPGGYYLATGLAKTFDADVAELEFERVVRSVNGEDVLYVFHARAAGAVSAAAVQRDPQGGRHPDHLPRVLAVRRRHADRLPARHGRADPGAPDAGVADAVRVGHVRRGAAGRHRSAGADRQRRPGPRHRRHACRWPGWSTR